MTPIEREIVRGGRAMNALATTSLSAYLSSVHACREAPDWVAGRPASAELWRSCESADWLLKIAADSGVDRRRVVLAASACGWLALRFVRSEYREVCARAVDLSRRFGLGEDIAIADLRAAAYAASYAADAAASAAARAAARAAAAAARAAYNAAAAGYAAGYAADAASYAAYGPGADFRPMADARKREHAAMCAHIRRVIGWPRVARALRAQGVEVVR